MSIENTHLGPMRISELMSECKSVYFIRITMYKRDKYVDWIFQALYKNYS